MTTKVWCIKEKEEFILVKKINEFNDKHPDTFATQIFYKEKENCWVCFLYYKSNGENKNGK